MILFGAQYTHYQVNPRFITNFSCFMIKEFVCTWHKTCLSNGEGAQEKEEKAASLCGMNILTFGNGEWRVGEVEPNQLSRELAEEAAGDCAIEEGAPIAHYVHQGDSLGGVGCAHNLNRHRRKGEGDMPNKMRVCFMEAMGGEV